MGKVGGGLGENSWKKARLLESQKKKGNFLEDSGGQI